jgi:hypothetical protein
MVVKRCQRCFAWLNNWRSGIGYGLCVFRLTLKPPAT